MKPAKIRTIHLLRPSSSTDANPASGTPAAPQATVSGRQDVVQALESETFSRTDALTAASELCGKALEYVARTFADVRAGKRVDLSDARSIARQVVAHLKAENGLLRLVLDRDAPFSLQLHSVNVAIIAAKTAQTLQWSDQRIQQVTLAGLVHDVGAAVRFPLSLRSRDSAAMRPDPDDMKWQPTRSAELVSGQSGFEWLRRIVAQVYERENGSGYPLGLRNGEICDEAKILGIANVFDACLHQRPGRPALTGHAAMQIIISDEYGFPEHIAKAVIQSFSVYPYNEYVKLNTGEIAVVTEVNPANVLRPVVKMLYSREGSLMSASRTVDLLTHSQLWVHCALTAAELPRSA